MKIALLLIPATNGSVDRKTYIADCIEILMKEDYMPLCPDFYEQFTRLSLTDCIKKILPFSEVIFVFENFDKGEKLIQLVESIDKQKPIYKRTLSGDIEKYQNSLITILNDVSAKLMIPVEVIRNKGRKREVVDARFIYYRRARKCTKASLAQIGLPVGRDHATVFSGLKQSKNIRQVIKLYERCYGREE